jgi:hypothetical protein
MYIPGTVETTLTMLEMMVKMKGSEDLRRWNEKRDEARSAS